MTDLIDPHSDSAPAADPAADRRARQARIALLRNPNRKPLPPPRRPPLLGRNLKLRSTRRPGTPPAPEPEVSAAEAPPVPDTPLLRDPEGRILRIDVDRLEAMTQALLPPRQVRSAYAEQILGPKPAAATTTPPDPKTLRDTLAPLAEEPAEGEPPPTPSGWRRLLGRLTGRP